MEVEKEKPKMTIQVQLCIILLPAPMKGMMLISFCPAIWLVILTQSSDFADASLVAYDLLVHKKIKN